MSPTHLSAIGRSFAGLGIALGFFLSNGIAGAQAAPAGSAKPVSPPPLPGPAPSATPGAAPPPYMYQEPWTPPPGSQPAPAPSVSQPAPVPPVYREPPPPYPPPPYP